MEYLVEYKWFFLIGAEISFWVLSVAFLLLRYLLDLDRASFVVLALIVLDNLFIAGLGFPDYLRTGEFATYQLVALAIIVYGLTYGKRDFKRLDRFMKRKVAGWKGEALPTAEPPPKAAPRQKAAHERRSFYGHLAVFIVGQAILFAVGESWLAAQVAGVVPEEPSALMSAGRIWVVVLVVDAIWSFSYTLFPKRTEALRAR